MSSPPLNKRIASILIRTYQLTLSPLLHWVAGPGMGCRFEPTCSHFAREAIETHGLFRGGLLSLGRILRCNPFSRAGSDPVPRVIAKSN